MIIRNLPFKGLNGKEKKIIKVFYKECMSDKTMECHKLHKNINAFWEEHREVDTNDGTYNGWVDENEKI